MKVASLSVDGHRPHSIFLFSPDDPVHHRARAFFVFVVMTSSSSLPFWSMLLPSLANPRARTAYVRTRQASAFATLRTRPPPTDHAHGAADRGPVRHSRARATRSKNLICRKPFLFYNTSNNLLLSCVYFSMSNKIRSRP